MIPYICEFYHIFSKCTHLFTYTSENLAVPDEDDNVKEWQAQIDHALKAIKDEQARRLREKVVEEMATDPNYSMQDLLMTTAAAEVADHFEDNFELVPEGAVDFGTAANFNYDAVIDIRLRHETAEARDAVARRFYSAAFMPSDSELISAAKAKAVPKKQATGRSTKGKDSLDGEEKSAIKGNIADEIVRVISSSLTSQSGRYDTSGLKRLERWRRAGVIPDLPLEQDASLAPALGVTGVVAAGRDRYLPLEQREPKFKFISAGISSSNPLQKGSVVVVVFREKMYLGIGVS